MEEVERKAKAQSLKGKQTALDEAEAAAVHWRDEWRLLGDETGEMVQQTFEILMDQVRHLNPAIDYSMITLDTRWNPKAKRIYNPKAEVQDQPEPVVKQPEPEAEEQRAKEVVKFVFSEPGLPLWCRACRCPFRVLRSLDRGLPSLLLAFLGPRYFPLCQLIVAPGLLLLRPFS
ncbi:hypothetical protein PIB30_070851 [Stylosanthes scabra]|uniref:Uncharacterized protein n=1 Tax=Stylosanthes scabra TaxID=79078 RepID=A0ABU6TQX3_9FABA|nr:hypothetical protein [Stylosanthes scabra]